MFIPPHSIICVFVYGKRIAHCHHFNIRYGSLQTIVDRRAKVAGGRPQSPPVAPQGEIPMRKD
jgi:hypothetical protein